MPLPHLGGGAGGIGVEAIRNISCFCLNCAAHWCWFLENRGSFSGQFSRERKPDLGESVLMLPASPLAGSNTGKGNWMVLSILEMELFKFNKPEPTAPTRLQSGASL